MNEVMAGSVPSQGGLDTGVDGIDGTQDGGKVGTPASDPPAQSEAVAGGDRGGDRGGVEGRQISLSSASSSVDPPAQSGLVTGRGDRGREAARGSVTVTAARKASASSSPTSPTSSSTSSSSEPHLGGGKQAGSGPSTRPSTRPSSPHSSVPSLRISPAGKCLHPARGAVTARATLKRFGSDSSSDDDGPAVVVPQTARPSSPGHAASHPLMFEDEAVVPTQMQRSHTGLGKPSTPAVTLPPPPAAVAPSSSRMSLIRRSMIEPAPPPPPPVASVGRVSLGAGETYEGQLLEGVPHGAGKSWHEGGIYQFRGMWESGRRQGDGTLLVTLPGEMWAVHCAWKDNRVDTRLAGLLEMASGDCYFGQLAAVSTATVADPFHVYVRSLSILKHGVGEWRGAGRGGGRYLGSWACGKRVNFGVEIAVDSKYYGLWDADSRDRRGTEMRSDGSMFEGGWRRGEPGGSGVLLLPNGASVRSDHWRGDQLTGRATCRQEAHTPSLWARTRIASSWGCGLSGMSRPREVRVLGRWTYFVESYMPELMEQQRRNEARESTFMAPSLALLEPTEGLDSLSDSSVADLRPKLESVLVRYIKSSLESAALRKPVLGEITLWFRRFFAFMYGTCASPDEIGAGQPGLPLTGGFLNEETWQAAAAAAGGRAASGSRKRAGEPQKELSYCANRNHFGGCFHRGDGVCIRPEHLHNACDDVVSFVYSLDNCCWLSLGDGLTTLLRDRMDLGGIVLRTLSDMVLGLVYPILRNLYRAVHRKEDIEFSMRIQSLSRATLDDLGVSFARHRENEGLFPPYDAAIRALGELGGHQSVGAKLACLKQVAKEIDRQCHLNLLARRSEEVKEEPHTQYTEVYAEHRRRAGSHPPVEYTMVEARSEGSTSPQVSVAENITPHATVSASDVANASVSENANTVSSMEPPAPVPATALPSAAQEAGMGILETSSTVVPPHVRVGAAERLVASTLFDESSSSAYNLARLVQGLEGGSADDLFPINLYVLIRSGARHFASELQFLLDWTSNCDIFDASSDDAYRLATIHACYSYVQELRWNIRDAQGVLVPFTVLEQRLAAAVEEVGREACHAGQDTPSFDSLPPVVWARDVFLWVSCVDPREWEEAGLTLPREHTLPRGCAQAAGTLLAAVGLELLFGTARVTLTQLRGAVLARQNMEGVLNGSIAPLSPSGLKAAEGGWESDEDEVDPLAWSKVPPTARGGQQKRASLELKQGAAGVIEVPPSCRLTVRQRCWHSSDLYEKFALSLATAPTG
eukprot:Hpha_TRINITY_DN15444_c1_g4::TRINITY_DN15444_c1_g4_i1::g.176110::m.176110